MFLTKLVLEQVDSDSWKLVQDLRYEEKGLGHTVPKGFVTDLASVPRIFRLFIPVIGRYTKSSVLHDHLCKLNLPRLAADRSMLSAMKAEGVGWLERQLIFNCLRGFHAVTDFKRSRDFSGLIIAFLLGTASLLFVLGVCVSAVKTGWWLFNNSLVHFLVNFLV